MRKQRTQTAFATLTEGELDQVAEWLRHHTYEVVLERVRKPRAEGGFGLNISRKPLERLYAKVALLDLINTKVSADKKLTLAQFESIAAGDVLLAPSESPEKSDILDSQFSTDRATTATSDIHEAILQTTHDLATSSDNTPTQLLALQRLADFPARAEYRSHKIQMDLHRKHVTDQRLELDRQKFAHKTEMDAFRKEVAAARLDLAKQSVALRQKQSDARVPPESSPSSDHLGPYARNWEEIGQRVCKQFNISPEEAARRIELRKAWKQRQAQLQIDNNETTVQAPESTALTETTSTASSVESVPSSAPATSELREGGQSPLPSRPPPDELNPGAKPITNSL